MRQAECIARLRKLGAKRRRAKVRHDRAGQDSKTRTFVDGDVVVVLVDLGVVFVDAQLDDKRGMIVFEVVVENGLERLAFHCHLLICTARRSTDIHVSSIARGARVRGWSLLFNAEKSVIVR